MNETNNSQDYLSMSDEDIDNIDTSSLFATEENTSEELEDTEQETNEEEQETSIEEEVEENSSSEEIEEEQENSIDYAEIGKKLFQPFKANGKEMNVNSFEEALALMQMGANYNKKMQEMNKVRPILKILEKHELLDTDKLSFLIDLNEKNPEAISKLIQDSGLSSYDFNEERASQYTPTNRNISSQELALEEVLDSIKESPEYNRTVQTLGNQWDEPSRVRLTQNPMLIRVINEHMENGMFDIITEEVIRQKALGNIIGMSDIDAYEAVGSALYANKTQEAPREEIKPKEEEIKRERVVASSNQKKTQNKTSLTPQDILNLSDEEFMKLNFT